MITLTPQQAIGYIILMPMAALVVLMAAAFLVRVYKRYAKTQEQSKLYKSMMLKVAEMKKQGEFHEWIEVPFSPTETVYACKKTGYVPKHDGFYPLSHIKEILRMKKEKEAFAQFKSDRLLEIAKTFGLKMDEIDGIYQEIVSMSKDYMVGNIDNLQKELENTAKELEESLK